MGKKMLHVVKDGRDLDPEIRERSAVGGTLLEH